MKRNKLLTLIAILFTLTTFAQNDLKARIAYEDAETAFVAEDYTTAVTHLTEAEKLLGKWTPKVGYLLIVSLSKTLDYENPNTKQLETLGKQIIQYMHFANNNKDIDINKFREINAIEKEVNPWIESFPDYKLGMEYLEKKDYENAMIFFKKAADKGNTYAMTGIGILFHNGGNGIVQNYTEAINWYKKAVDKENPKAMYLMGNLYDEGSGVAQNYTEAVEWYKKAAEKNHITSMHNLSVRYKYGLGVQKNLQAAKEWETKYKEAETNEKK